MRIRSVFVLAAAALVASTALAAGTGLNAVLYPEGEDIKVKFLTTERAPKATLLRFVGSGDGLAVDPSQRAAGRGAYLHRNTQCFDTFVRRCATA